jgi:hypothetical protein
MPAINPSHLKRQVEEAMTQAGSGELLVRSIRSIVEYYADRTKRSTAASEALIMSTVLRVPRPVMDSICSAIHAQEFLPAVRRRAAEGLWELEYRETRQLAVCLARGIDPIELTGIFERWGENCDDPEVLSWMAEEGLQEWWQAAEVETWRTLRRWMEAEPPRVRHFALLALRTAVERRTSDADLPRIFRLLKGAAGEVRGEAYAALVDLIRSLNQRSMRETARYLMDEIRRDTPGIKRLVRTCLDEFTPDLRRELEAAL